MTKLRLSLDLSSCLCRLRSLSLVMIVVCWVILSMFVVKFYELRTFVDRIMLLLNVIRMIIIGFC